MSPLAFSERLDGKVADTVRRDALVLMRNYGILSRRELFEQKYAANVLRMPKLKIPISKLPGNPEKYIFKKVGKKVLIFAGGTVVGKVLPPIGVVANTYAAGEIAMWSHRHLFIPDRDAASKDRAAMFREVIDAFE